jgi:hypothetical protein
VTYSDLPPEEEGAVELRSPRRRVSKEKRAVRQSDPREFDRLTRHALGLIERARAIQRGQRPVRGSIPHLVHHESERRKMMDMTRRAAAEFFGTFWLVLGDCGAAVLAVAFPALGIGYVGTVEAMLNHPGYQTSLGSTQEACRGNG